jgi:protocatechuate 3,4-dioxygenase beta subunit
MSGVSRRQLLSGLAAFGVGGLVLRADAAPTPEAGETGEHEQVFRRADPEIAPTGKFQPTEDCILGPYFRPGAPYRAKITPPLEPGTVLLVRGRVWGFDSKKPLPFARLDIWQANASGRYDNDDPRNPPKEGVFLYRARLVTDENGYYEYETVHPGPYQTGPDTWRPSHVHYRIAATGYKELVTQLFFKGDRFNKTDAFIKDSLIIQPALVKAGAQNYELGTFDIVLAPGR